MDKLREALKFAREAIWSGGDSISALAKIDAALAQPQNGAEAEEVGWTGKQCPSCKGCGMVYRDGDDNERACPDCGGTGDEYDFSPKAAPPSPERMREALFLFREFINHNVTHWQTGAGDHHHPIWGFIAEALGDENNRTRTQAEWRFIQPHNREALRAGDNHASDGKESEGGATRTFVRQLVDDPNSASGKSLRYVEVKPSDPTPPDREEIARIIDPNAGWGIQLDGDYFDLREAQAKYEGLQRRALTKADRILALRGGE